MRQRRTARTAARRGSATPVRAPPPGCAVPTRGTRGPGLGGEAPPPGARRPRVPVSYTHLTLPTICSV
eukprot:3016888-Prymnesium_polylepis.1